jgi:hypothetical protein
MPALEDFVKQAEIDADQQDSLPDSAYAWPAMRKFPIHSAPHAAMSYAYSKVASSLPLEVHANIKKALEVYEIPADVFTEHEEKVAAFDPDPDTYLLPDLKLFPVTTPQQCKRAQEDLVAESLTKLALEYRAVACANLVKKADALNVPLVPTVLQLAGLTVSDTKTASDWLEARVDRLPADDTVHRLAYSTLAQGLRDGPSERADRPGLLKFAAAVADLDEQTHLDKHYDRRLPDALRTVFNTTKLAAQSVDLGGTFVPLTKIARLPASFWEDLGGKELSDEIAPGGVVDQSKLATIVETLPLDLKLTLKAQCR